MTPDSGRNETLPASETKGNAGVTWRADGWDIFDGDGEFVACANVTPVINRDQCYANAALIVRAVNDYDAAQKREAELTKALEEAPRPETSRESFLAYLDWFYNARVRALSASPTPVEEAK